MSAEDDLVATHTLDEEDAIIEEDDDQEVEEMKRRVKLMEEEATLLRKLTDEAQKKAEAASAASGAAGGATTATDQERAEADTRSIHVSQVEYSATPEELQQHFAQCGSINRVTIISDKFTGPKGYAYVEFAKPEAVADAILLDGSEFKGRQLKVTHKRTNVPGMNYRGRGRGGARGGRGGRGGYRGGYQGTQGFSPYGGGGGYRGRGRGRGGWQQQE